MLGPYVVCLNGVATIELYRGEAGIPGLANVRSGLERIYT